MNETPSLALALLDFGPVIAFGAGSYYLCAAARRMCGARWAQMAILGSLLVFLGGGAKALAKLLASVGMPGLAGIGEIHFITQAPGFLLLLVVSLAMARAATVPLPRAHPILAMAAWKVPLVVIMALAGTGAHALLAATAWRRGARLAAAGFLVGMLCLLAMGGVSAGEQTVSMQWLEESINLFGQLGFLAGSLFLLRSLANGKRDL